MRREEDREANDGTDNTEDTSSEDVAKSRLNLATYKRIVLSAGTVLAAAYFISFGLGAIDKLPWGGPSSWGEFGDFFGGLLNPVVGMVTIVLLVRTLEAQLDALDLQRKELRLQREELTAQRKVSQQSAIALNEQSDTMHRQSVEQSLFSWLQNYSRFIAEFSDDTGITGRNAMEAIHRQHFSATACSCPLREDLMKYAAEPVGSPGNISLQRHIVRSLHRYSRAYKKHQTALGIQFRTLYRLIRWIDGTPKLKEADKWHYIALVRAQLSWIELVFLFYGGLTHDGYPFVALANKYALFDNLEEGKDPLIEAILAAPLEAARGHEPLAQHMSYCYPYKMSAFHSDIAKINLNLDENI